VVHIAAYRTIGGDALSSKIMSPSRALASVDELADEVNEMIVSAERNGTGGGAFGVGGCADANAAVIKKISTE
jgi:hypothetical protein